LPLLTCGQNVVSLSGSQLDKLNSAWNNVYRKIFHMKPWESVKEIRDRYCSALGPIGGLSARQPAPKRREIHRYYVVGLISRFQQNEIFSQCFYFFNIYFALLHTIQYNTIQFIESSNKRACRNRFVNVTIVSSK